MSYSGGSLGIYAHAIAHSSKMVLTMEAQIYIIKLHLY